MKKRVVFLILVVFILSFTIPSMAVDTFVLNYWYSDSSQIYFWSDTSLVVYALPYESSMSSSSLNSYIATSFARWNPATGITYSSTNTQSDADISVLGLSRDSANANGVPDNAIGIGFVSAKTLVGKGTVNGTTKNVYQITGTGQVYFVWETDTSGLGSTEWQKLFVHEFGHVFGYIGHYDSGAVMKPSFVNITTSYPNTNEKNHIGQIY